MSLLIINGSADLYGASRIMLTAISKLQEVEKLVLVVPASGPMLEELKERKIHAEVLVYPRLPVIARYMYSPGGMLRLAGSLVRTFFYLRKVKKRHGCRQAYVNTQSCLFLLKVCRMLKIKTFLHLHEILDKPAAAAAFINRKSLRWADHIICVSRPVEENLLRYADREVRAAAGRDVRAKVTTVLNGIEDSSGIIDAGEKAAGGEMAENEIIVSLIGRIKPEKGIWFFLDTIQLLPADIAGRCRFLLVGDPPPKSEEYDKKLKEAIAINPYSGRIRHISFTKNVSVLQERSDILVVPSLMRDPFPTTILEAMAAGKPVIATNTGGSVQSVAHGETGFLIEPGDTKSFSHYLQLLIKDDKLRSEMGKKAREKFLREFTVEIFQRNFLETYNRIKNEEIDKLSQH